MPREKKPKVDTSNWRELPLDSWNVRTFLAYFADMNREYFGADEYFPMRTWAFEQGALKRAITQYGAGTLKAACDIAFAEYRPNRKYPLLTAGFVMSYRINAIIPRLQAESKRKEAAGPVNGGMSAEEVAEWL